MISSTSRSQALLRIGASCAALVVLGACDRFEPEWVDALNFEPDSVHISPGQTATFTATPISQSGTELPDRAERVEFTLGSGASQILDAQPSVGSITVTAKALGTVPVRATLGRGAGVAQVHVVPGGLATVSISETSITLNPGQSVGVRAILRDANGNEVSHEGHRLSWATGDPNIARVAVINTNLPTTGVRAIRSGSTNLLLIVSGRTVSIPVIVN